MEKNENPRLKMLGLLTKEENALVLYDALSARDFAKFSYFIEKGYAISAFILNCMIDFGFEGKISETLKCAQRHDNNIYEFMVAYWGQEQAEVFFIGHNFKNLITQKFSDESIEKYQLWDIAVENGNYKLLLKNEQLQVIKDNVNRFDTKNLVNALIAAKQFALVVELGGEYWLRGSAAGCRYLWEIKDWNTLFRASETDLRIYFNCESIEDVYDKMIADGATDYFYKYSGKTQQHLLKRGIIKPFVDEKDWFSLYCAERYEAINLNEWWTERTSDVVVKKFIETAVRTKNWDFLEQRKCFKALFKNFRWQRCYRIWKG